MSFLPLLTSCAADLAHVRTLLGELRTEHRTLAAELEAHYLDEDQLDPNDGFPRKMFRFSREAKERLENLRDLVELASGSFSRAVEFFGEDHKSIATTQAFFEIFKTFVTSYKKARDEDRQARERAERAAQLAARKAAAAEEAAKKRVTDSPIEDALDDVMRKLRMAEPRRRKDRSRGATPSTKAHTPDSNGVMDVDLTARSLLSDLQGEGYTPSDAPKVPNTRRARRARERPSEELLAEEAAGAEQHGAEQPGDELQDDAVQAADEGAPEEEASPSPMPLLELPDNDGNGLDDDFVADGEIEVDDRADVPVDEDSDSSGDSSLQDNVTASMRLMADLDAAS